MNEKEEKLADIILDAAIVASDLDRRNALLGHYLGLMKAVEHRLCADNYMYENFLIMNELEAADNK